VPTGGQMEPSAQLKAGRFLTIVATGLRLKLPASIVAE
jgi:hypothetical protein